MSPDQINITPTAINNQPTLNIAGSQACDGNNTILPYIASKSGDNWSTLHLGAIIKATIAPTPIVSTPKKALYIVLILSTMDTKFIGTYIL